MFTRSTKNPILKPDANYPWCSKKVYNPAILFNDNKYHLFFRAVDENGKSSIGYGCSDDGEIFEIKNEPIIKPIEKYETRGAEDPRIAKINDKYFITYTGYDGQSARLHIATSDNLIDWQKYGLAIPNWDMEKAKGFVVSWDFAQQTEIAKKEWSKAGGIFSEKIKEQYWMIFGDRNIWLATSNNGINWEPIWQPFITPRKGLFDSEHVEMGPSPIKTDFGWLVLYHGIDDKMVYRLGYLLLGLNDPSKILYRSNEPIFEPSASYELEGIIDITNNNKPKVIFCCGAVLINNTLKIYYGAGDSVICTASTDINNLIKNF